MPATAAAMLLKGKGEVMVDGTRKRRHSSNRVKREWYARHRAIRFSRRFLAAVEA